MGVSRSQATKITGHKTESIYKRYAIVNERDQREEVQKIAGLWPEAKPAEEGGQKASTAEMAIKSEIKESNVSSGNSFGAGGEG